MTTYTFISVNDVETALIKSFLKIKLQMLKKTSWHIFIKEAKGIVKEH